MPCAPKRAVTSQAGQPTLPVALTHPDRVLWPAAGITKQGLAEFYAELWPWISPYIVNRPLSLVRCPGGVDEACFFQKHAWAGIERARRALARSRRTARRSSPSPTSRGSCRWCRPRCWRSTCGAPRSTDIEKPDGITFDLDPAPEVGLGRRGGRRHRGARPPEAGGARQLREDHRRQGAARLRPAQAARGLGRRQGLRAQAGQLRWRRTAQASIWPWPPRRRGAGASSSTTCATASGATAVAAYSTRARAEATVSTPLAWEELGPQMQSGRFTVVQPAAPPGARARPMEGHAQDARAGCRG